MYGPHGPGGFGGPHGPMGYGAPGPHGPMGYVLDHMDLWDMDHMDIIMDHILMFYAAKYTR